MWKIRHLLFSNRNFLKIFAGAHLNSFDVFCRTLMMLIVSIRPMYAVEHTLRKIDITTRV